MPAAPAIQVALVHLGCARNLIDSETILGRLGAEGYGLTGTVEEADVGVLNTCSFLGAARDESHAAIEDLVERKRRGELRAVIVVGCLVEKFLEQTRARHPDVDAFLGLSDYGNVARVVEEVLKGRRVEPGAGGRVQRGQAEGPRLLQTPRSYAYLRPSHGCDHQCAFCIIPSIRGRQRSKPLAAVVAEAEQLVAQGVRELVLVAEDTTGYGTDFGPGGPRLPELVEALADVRGLVWVRVMYAYPNAFPWRLAEVMRERENVLPYLDIPIQHIASPVLKRMRRGGTHDSVRALLERLRTEVPGIALRTTVLVGHPGEGRAEFEELLRFLEEFRFERLGAFAFSPEAGAPASDDGARCTPEEAAERLQAVMEIQASIHAEHQRALVGTSLHILVDSHESGQAIGRTSRDAPEVDGLVRIDDADASLQPGDLVEAEITGADGFDLLVEG